MSFGERWRRGAGQRLSRPLGEALARAEVNPTLLTALGLLWGIAAGGLLAIGSFFWGSWLVLGSAALDLLDGAVARAGGRATQRGALLDSVFDRISEVAALSGLLAYFLARDASTEVALAFAAVAGSMLVSYIRARAEGLGLPSQEGLATRPERVLILAVGLMINQVTIALWVLAIAANLTALHRLVAVARRARG